TQSGYSGDQSWLVWGGEQRQALVRAVSHSRGILHENQSAGGGPTRRRATSEDDLRLSRTPESARGLRGASLKEDDVEAIPSNRRFRAGASLLDIRNRLPPMLSRGPQQNRRPRAMKGFVTILAVVLAVGFT